MDYEEFKNYILGVKEQLFEYKHTIEETSDDIIPGINNMEFIFRLDIIDYLMEELSTMENKLDE